MSDSYRQELSKQGIQVVCVEPGAIESQFQSTVASVQTKKTELSKIVGQDAGAVKEYYEYAMDELEKKTKDQLKMQQSPTLVSDVLVDIILSPKPHVRYTAGKDAALVSALLPWLWSNAFDSMTAGAFQDLSFFKRKDNKKDSTAAEVPKKADEVKVD